MTATQALRFGTIRNNTALKPHMIFVAETGGFGTIQNNTALKLNFGQILPA